MVMKVVNINPILFKKTQVVTKSEMKNNNNHQQVDDIAPVTPDFSVKAPQKYTKLGVKTLSNGLNIHSYKLANGYRVTIVPMENSPAVVKNYVNVGSMNETDDIKGISHFLEHMAFNGTNGENGYIKLNQGDSFKKIDKLGGWINASTNYALTDYVNSTPLLKDSDLEEQIKIIAGMTEDLSLTDEMIEKEKGPVCSEIDMILDNPRTVLTDVTLRTLFNINSSADELVGGSVNHIKNLTREKVKDYYDKYYTPDNMNLVITGEVDPQKTIELVAKNFHSTKKSNGNFYEEKLTPINKSIRKDLISDKTKSTEIMLGFKGPKNNDYKAKIIFDIVSEYLNSSEVGLYKDLKDNNSYGYFGIEKVSTNAYNPTLLYFTTSASEESSEKVLKIIYDRLSNVPTISEKQLNIIKEGMLQGYHNLLEYSGYVNNVIGNDIINGNPDGIEDFFSVIKTITPADVDNFMKEYVNLDKVALTLVHPDKKAINNENSINFKGRKPLNMNKIEEKRLDNNYKLAFYETKNNNISFSLTLNYDYPEDMNRAALSVLDEIMNKGSKNTSEDEMIKFEEENNVNIYSSISNKKLRINGHTSREKFDMIADKSKEILYSPRITQEEVDIAVKQISDSLSRAEDNSFSIYVDYESKNNPNYTSKEKMLEDLKKVTVEDVKKLHEYIINNSVGYFAINNPVENSVKEEATKKFNEFTPVKDFEYKKASIYKPNEKTKVLVKDKNTSQADIMQIHKFKFDDSIKNRAILDIMNTILSSSSIGLFNTLREKENLAYSVYSDYNVSNDLAELSCSILTTTDNKDNGTKSYENVQKSINGFNRQINALKNSEYTDEDLQSAKNILKAHLLDTEGIHCKISILNQGLNSEEGMDYDNKMYEIIDTITREDIDNMAKYVFENKPIYSVVASKDTLDANKDFFETLESV